MKEPIIWIIDDDEGILESTSLFLEEEGFEVRGFINERLFCEALKKQKPDLILLDILLSGPNGIDICLKLKKDKATNKIPVLLMSADNRIETKAKQAKANGYIKKPFDIAEMITRVNDVV